MHPLPRRNVSLFIIMIIVVVVVIAIHHQFHCKALFMSYASPLYYHYYYYYYYSISRGLFKLHLLLTCAMQTPA